MERMSLDLSAENASAIDGANPPKQSGRSTFDEILRTLKEIVSAKAFPPVAVAFIGICIFFWPLVAHLPGLWETDDHYSHGWLIPFISGYVIYKWWPDLSKLPLKPAYASVILLPPILFIGRAAMLVDQQLLVSFMFLASILVAIWFMAGTRWMLGLALPVLYTAFMLPVWLSIIDVYTYPLQLISTKGAYHILTWMGQQPQMDSMHPTDIYLANFNLNVAVPCSGMKTLLAIGAFTAFFLMIANIKWWSRLALIAVVMPLSLVTNACRIALVGLVGNQFGEAAGHQFHDYSGYIMLVVCFYVLFKLARSLGWKD